MLSSWAYVPGPGCSSRWRPRLGPRLHCRHALCEPCVSRTGSCPSVCGRRSRAELHIQDNGPRMLPSSAAPGRRACCTHPCCSFPCSALGAHGTLHSPGRSKHLRVLCTTNLEVRQMLTHHQRLETTHTLSRDSAPCWLRELRRSRWRWSNGYALVPVDRDRVEEPPHGAAEEPPAPGEPGDRRVDRSAEHPHQRARPATGTGLRHQASPRFTPSAQTTAGFRAMVSSRTSEKPAWARAASISRPQAAEVSSLAPGPRG
jgi:hypothetical protein